MSKKISELTEVLEPNENDVLPIVSGGETKKVKLAAVKEAVKPESVTETDPTVPSHVKNITEANISTWNNKAEKSDIPTVPTKVSELTNDKGYLTSYTETDPTVPSHVKNITQEDIDTWNNPSEYTLPTATADTLGGVKVGAGLSISNGVLSATGGGTADSVEWANIQNIPEEFTPSTHTHTKEEITDFPTIPSKTSDLTNDSGFITGYTESDPTVPSHVKNITQANITSWNNKQAPLTAGENITINNGVISATGGGEISNAADTLIRIDKLKVVTQDVYESTELVEGTAYLIIEE